MLIGASVTGADAMKLFVVTNYILEPVMVGLNAITSTKLVRTKTVAVLLNF